MELILTKAENTQGQQLFNNNVGHSGMGREPLPKTANAPSDCPHSVDGLCPHLHPSFLTMHEKQKQSKKQSNSDGNIVMLTSGTSASLVKFNQYE